MDGWEVVQGEVLVKSHTVYDKTETARLCNSGVRKLRGPRHCKIPSEMLLPHGAQQCVEMNEAGVGRAHMAGVEG